ncbi:MAG: ABC transporter ATP-binding protein [Betaproteobacteria bacterium]|jgi:putative ABC transport system ATP-binding protein
MQPVGLRIHGLRRAFGPRAILHDLSLELAAGQYVAIVGESGAGKSTLLNLIAGLDRPDGGRIEIGGDDIGALDEAGRTRLRRQRVGFVFQAFHILPHLTVAQNVELPLVLLGVATDERRARAQALLAEVGLGDRGSSAPRELSGGELQRVAVARAIVHRPALLLADEPTGNLDPETADGVLTLLATTIRRSGACGILVTHSQHAAATADRVLQLRQGALHAAA